MTIKEFKKAIENLPEEATITIPNIHESPKITAVHIGSIDKKEAFGPNENDVYFEFKPREYMVTREDHFKYLAESLGDALSHLSRMILNEGAKSKDLVTAYNILCDIYNNHYEDYDEKTRIKFSTNNGGKENEKYDN